MAAYRQVHDSRHLQAMRQDMMEFWDAVDQLNYLKK